MPVIGSLTSWVNINLQPKNCSTDGVSFGAELFVWLTNRRQGGGSKGRSGLWSLIENRHYFAVLFAQDLHLHAAAFSALIFWLWFELLITVSPHSPCYATEAYCLKEGQFQHLPEPITVGQSSDKRHVKRVWRSLWQGPKYWSCQHRHT